MRRPTLARSRGAGFAVAYATGLVETMGLDAQTLPPDAARAMKGHFIVGWGLALQGARALGISLPNRASCQELFSAAIAAGGKAWDHSAMVRVLKRLACHEIGQPRSMVQAAE